MDYESGGRCDAQGIKTGKQIIGDNGHSWGCFQTNYGTFRQWSMEILGYVGPDNYWTQRYVVTMKVQQWINEGLSDRSIALRYNHPASNGTCSKGFNTKIGVPYDSCAYVGQILARL